MGDFFKGLFSPVVNWLTGEGGKAIASAAIKGAISGAVMGAAAAAIKGDDILKGALKGAAYGGAVGGAIGAVTNLAGLGTDAPKVELSNDPTKIMQNRLTGGDNMVEDRSFGGGNFYKNEAPANTGILASGGGSSSGKTPVPNNTPGKTFGVDNEIVAGVGKGVAQGALGYLSAENTADANREIADRRIQEERAKIEANKPGGILAAQTANIQIQSWWDRHLNKTTGLPTTGVA